MPRTKAKFRNALPLLAVVAAACDHGGPRGEAVFAPEPAATRIEAARGFLSGWSSPHHADLTRLLEIERTRIAAERALSTATYATLRRDRSQASKPDGSSPFVFCEPLPYAGSTAIIGPEGGDLRMGPHSLRIPAGALREFTVITGEARVSNRVEVTLSPHGLNFLKEPTLLLSYRHCQVQHASPYRLAYVNESGAILEWPVSRDDVAHGELSGWIWHFSTYTATRGYTPAGG